MKEIGYTTISTVLEIWDKARFGANNKNFDADFGTVALLKLFELQPRAMFVFGYDEDNAEGMLSVSAHAKSFAVLFDSVFQMLGPDLEFIEEILGQVGRKHKQLEINPNFFPFMGQAVIFALEEFLGSKLTSEQRGAWEEVYENISNEIVKNILS